MIQDFYTYEDHDDGGGGGDHQPAELQKAADLVDISVLFCHSWSY